MPSSVNQASTLTPRTGNAELPSAPMAPVTALAYFGMASMGNTEISHTYYMTAADLYKTKHANEISAIFCAGIVHTEKMTELFRDENIPADRITSDIEQKQQVAVIEKLKNGEINV